MMRELNNMGVQRDSGYAEADGKSPSEDDRRTLVSIYSSSQMQYAALTFAAGAGLLAESIYLLSAGASAFYLFLVVSAIPPTLMIAAVTAKAYIVETFGIREVLYGDIPSKEQFTSVLESAKDVLFVPPHPVSYSNGLGALDMYYTALTRVEFREDKLFRLMLKGIRTGVVVLASLLGISLLLTTLIARLAFHIPL